MLLIGGVTLIDFVGALAVARVASKQTRIHLLSVIIGLNLGLLGFWKYTDFFGSVLSSGLAGGFEPLELLLPVGISFFTFQGLSYVIDVYRGDIAPERSLFRFALYIAFFPQLVAGPIVRAGQLLPQLGAPLQPRRAHLRPCAGAHLGRAVEEGRARRLPRRQPGGPRVRFAVALLLARGVVRGLRLRAADLWRLFRLLRHRDRRRAAGRDPAAHQLRSAVPRRQHARLLAPLAHHIVAVVARLSLHQHGRFARRPLAHPSQPDDHHAARRPVAWRVVQLRDLGSDARRGARRRTHVAWA